MTASMNELDSIHAADEEIVAIVENDACGVDALQCVTGCTFGKGNLIFRDYGITHQSIGWKADLHTLL